MRRAGQIYQESGRQEDALRCFKEGLDFRSAMHLVYSGRRYEEGVDVLKTYEYVRGKYGNLHSELTPPPADMTLKKLLWTAARMHHKEGKSDKMDSVVDKFPDFESKVKFYKQFGLSGQVVQTLLRAGREKEAKEMLFDAHDYLEAAKITSSDYSFNGECYLLEAAKLIQWGTPPDSKEMAEKYANLSWIAFGRVGDSLGQGMATLLLAISKRNVEELQNSRATFQPRRADCLSGEVEATTLMVTVRQCSDGDIKAAQYTLERAVKLYLCLLSSKSTSDKQQQLEKCFRFYGYHEVGTDQYETNELHSVWTKSTAPHSMSRREAQSVMAHRAVELLKRLIERVRTKLMEQVETGRLCVSFVTGYDCTEGETCRHQHLQSSSEYMIGRTKLLERLLGFEVAVVSALDGIQKQIPAPDVAVQAIVRDIRKKTVPVVKLLSEILCPGDSDLCLISPNEALADLLLGLSRQLRDFVIREINKEFRMASSWRRQSDLNFTYQLWNLYQSFCGPDGRNPLRRLLFEEESTVNERLRHLSRRERQYRLSRIGALVNRESSRAKLFVRLWIDSKNMLFSDSDFVKASFTALKRFLTRPLNITNWPKPSVIDSITILESEILLCLTLAIHLQQPIRLRACLPASYVDNVQFANRLMTGDASWHLKEMQKYRNRTNLLKQVRQLLQYAVDLLLGSVSVTYNLLELALTKEQFLRSGGAERCVTLVLVLLINAAIGFTVPATNELRLRKALLDAAEGAGSRLPARLSASIEGVKGASVVGDVVRVLAKVLSERGDYLADVTTKDSKHLCYVRTVVDEYYEERPLMRMATDRGEEETQSETEEVDTCSDETDGRRDLFSDGLTDDTNDDDDPEEDIEIEEEMEKFTDEELRSHEKEVRQNMAVTLSKQQAARRLLNLLSNALETRQRNTAATKYDNSGSLQEHFGAYVIDDFGCTICGVSFKRDSDLEDSNSNGLAPAGTQSRIIHEQNTRHISTMSGFLTYKTYYGIAVHKVCEGVREFLKELQNCEAWIKERLQHEMSELEIELKAFGRKVLEVEKQRTWHQGRLHLTIHLNNMARTKRELQTLYEDISRQESGLRQPEEQPEMQSGDNQRSDVSGARNQMMDDVNPGSDLPDHLFEEDDLDVTVKKQGRSQKKAGRKRRKKTGKK